MALKAVQRFRASATAGGKEGAKRRRRGGASEVLFHPSVGFVQFEAQKELGEMRGELEKVPARVEEW